MKEEVGSDEIIVGALSWRQKIVSIAVRFLVCAFALFLAELIPFFGDLLTLIGSVTATSSVSLLHNLSLSLSLVGGEGGATRFLRGG